METKINISLETISNFLKKYYFWILGVIFFLLFCLSIFIYYQHIYLTINTQLDPTQEEIVIDQEMIEKVMGNIEGRQDNLSRVEKKDYQDPFND